jgi:hypothetical protein
MQLGAKHVETPFIEFGQISTVLYFSYFLIIIPCISLLENSLIELTSDVKESSSTNNTSYYSLAKSNISGIISLLLIGTIFANEYNSSINLCDVPRP